MCILYLVRLLFIRTYIHARHKYSHVYLHVVYLVRALLVGVTAGRASNPRAWLTPKYVKFLAQILPSLHGSGSAIIAAVFICAYINRQQQWMPQELKGEAEGQTEQCGACLRLAATMPAHPRRTLQHLRWSPRVRKCRLCQQRP